MRGGQVQAGARGVTKTIRDIGQIAGPISTGGGRVDPRAAIPALHQLGGVVVPQVTNAFGGRGAGAEEGGDLAVSGGLSVRCCI